MTYVPAFERVFWRTKRKHRRPPTPRQAYCIWLRHLVSARTNGWSHAFDVVAELGPGDNLGVGMAALISGAKRYFAFDLVRAADINEQLVLFDELVELFARAAAIPDESEFPAVKPLLDGYEFPHHLWPRDQLKRALAPQRLAAIRTAIQHPGEIIDGYEFSYVVPWSGCNVVENTVDLIVSQAVLEHVDELGQSYDAMKAWLRPGGLMSHQIDFKCHGTTSTWNGHWTLNEKTWRLIKGRRAYLINRLPYSVHRQLWNERGFEVLADVPVDQAGGVPRRDLAPEYAHLSDQDLHTSGVFVQARKPVASP